MPTRQWLKIGIIVALGALAAITPHVIGPPVTAVPTIMVDPP